MTEALNKSQLNELSADLGNLADRLEELLAATLPGTKPVKLKENQGRLSRMDELHNQSILLANRNVTENRLKAVNHARQRVSDGSYGCCTTCDDPIAFNRLKAYPDASMCIECKMEAE